MISHDDAKTACVLGADTLSGQLHTRTALNEWALAYGLQVYEFQRRNPQRGNVIVLWTVTCTRDAWDDLLFSLCRDGRKLTGVWWQRTDAAYTGSALVKAIQHHRHRFDAPPRPSTTRPTSYDLPFWAPRG